jgi:hypothetical protein
MGMDRELARMRQKEVGGHSAPADAVPTSGHPPLQPRLAHGQPQLQLMQELRLAGPIGPDDHEHGRFPALPPLNGRCNSRMSFENALTPQVTSRVLMEGSDRRVLGVLWQQQWGRAAGPTVVEDRVSVRLRSLHKLDTGRSGYMLHGTRQPEIRARSCGHAGRNVICHGSSVVNVGEARCCR